ncbi:MAG: urate hydroxylase PuuD, partial [Labrys sp. (in: a-proteobacteria)]
MEAFAAEWLNLLIRWAHIIVGIAWIGASFHFVWLDFSLRKRERMNAGVYGTSWMVHGGGFYHVEKYSVAPSALPPDLHWFKWEAYLTWLTGMMLLAVQYYWQAETYLIDPAVMDITRGQAILISLGTLIGGWIIYDQL